MRAIRLAPSRVLAPGLALAIAAVLTPILPAAAATVVTETYHVDTVDDAVIRVEVTRDTSFPEVPVILTYSPYNTTREPTPSNDSYAKRYVPLGYARAVADVLGTRGSTGCWDYGGPKEQQSGVDVVKFLAAQPWSNGRVAMIGGSYDGTTANMVAARGPDVPELKAIVPISAISHWYGYAYGNGVRYFLNSEVATDEGFDTPLAFDYGFGRTVAPDPDDPNFEDTLLTRFGPCEFDSVEHTEEGYSRQPDYDQFWRERSYRKDAGSFRAAVLMAHGWQDYNVKQEESIALWRALPVDRPGTSAVEGVPFKLLYMTQDAHSTRSLGAEWQALVDRFLEHTLKGVSNGIDQTQLISTTYGRTVTAAGSYQTLPPKYEADWPPPGTRDIALYLQRGAPGTLQSQPAARSEASYMDIGAATEEISLRDPLLRSGQAAYGLFYQSAPLAGDVRLAGSAMLHAWVKTQSPGQHLTPILVDVLPTGDLRLVERGFLNLDYRNGLERGRPMTPGEWARARVALLPQDFTFPAGHRIGLIIQSSNTVWAVPGAAGRVDVAHGAMTLSDAGTRLILPVVGPS
jgi:X-Pro dipeptidyl-peptidase